MSRILVVDDEIRYCQILDLMLRHENHEVVTATDGQQAARLVDEQELDVIISDLSCLPITGWISCDTGMSWRRRFLSFVLTAFGTIPSAVEMVREGPLTI